MQLTTATMPLRGPVAFRSSGGLEGLAPRLPEHLPVTELFELRELLAEAKRCAPSARLLIAKRIGELEEDIAWHQAHLDSHAGHAGQVHIKQQMRGWLALLLRALDGLSEDQVAAVLTWAVACLDAVARPSIERVRRLAPTEEFPADELALARHAPRGPPSPVGRRGLFTA